MAIITLNNNSLSSVTALPAGVPTGSWTKLAETNVTTSTASVEFTDATTGVFDGTYRTHAILVRRLVPSSDQDRLALQMRDASDGVYETASYAFITHGRDSSNNLRIDQSTSASKIMTLGGGDGMGDGTETNKYGSSCIIYCNDFLDNGIPPTIFGQGTYSRESGYNCVNHFSGTYRDTSIQMDGVKLVFNTGNILQGNFIMYGVKE